MKWTAEKDAEFRALARTCIGGPRIADRMGVTISALYARAQILDVSIARASSVSYPESSYDEASLRWAALIGPMKERLRADVAMIMASP
jgi:hypothetical protein